MFELFATPNFLILALALIALALVFVVTPMLGGDPRLKTLRRRRRALEELRNDLDPLEYRKRLAGLEAEQKSLGGAEGGNPRGLLPLMVMLIPLATLLVYSQVGTPDGLKPDRGENAEIREALGDLAQKVNADPLDLESWNQIGMIWKSMRQFNTAEAAFRRVLFHEPENPVAIVELSETLLFGSGRPHLTGEGRAMLEALVQRQPNNQKALWLLGFNAMQLGNREAAVNYWVRLERLLPEGSVREQISSQIAQARGMPMDAVHAPLAAAPSSGGQRTNSVASSAVTPAAPMADPPAQPAPSSGDDAGVSISVDVSVAPALQSSLNGNEVVFVFARAANGPPAPLAVKRFRVADLPTRITLSDADAMTEGLTLATFPQIEITARVSRSGNAISAPGDLEGRSGSLDPRRTGQIELSIDQTVE